MIESKWQKVGWGERMELTHSPYHGEVYGGSHKADEFLQKPNLKRKNRRANSWKKRSLSQGKYVAWKMGIQCIGIKGQTLA